MLPQLLHNLTGEWHAGLRRAGVCLKRPLSALQMGGSQGRDRKVLFFIFNSDEDQPALILKLARSPGYQKRLEREFQALHDISAVPAIQNTVPKLLGLFHLGEHLIIAESCLPGIPLSVLLRRHERITGAQIREDVFRVQDWLQQFQVATTSGTVTFGGRAAIEEQLARLDGPNRGVALPCGFIGMLLGMAHSYDGLQLPLTGRHGDLWPANFLLAKSAVGVIDWEDFTRCQSPLYDMFLFITTYAWTCPWGTWRWPSKTAAFRRAFLEKTWFSNVVYAYVSRFLRAMALPEQTSHLFFSLFLLEMATLATLHGQRRVIQANPWLTILSLYAENYPHSIFI